MLTATVSHSARADWISRSWPAWSAPIVGTRPMFFFDSRNSRSSPDFAQKIILRNLHKHRFVRIAQAVVDEAHVRAPALITRDLVRFIDASGRFPEHLEIHVGLTKIADRLSEFTRSNAAIEINHCR